MAGRRWMYRPADSGLPQLIFQGQQQILEHLPLLIYHFDQSFDTVAKIILISRVKPGHRDCVIDRLKVLEQFTRQ